MVSRRYSEIGHTFLPCAAPIGADVVDELLRILPLGPGQKVVDVGCGRAELLLRCLKLHPVEGIGIDTDSRAIEFARKRSEDLGISDRVRFVQTAADAASLPRGCELGMCVGSSHALGGLTTTLSAFADCLAPNALLLLGEGYWKAPPAREYLESFGGSADEITDRFSVVSRAAEQGWEVIWSFMSRDEDWDRYEGLYRFGLARHLRTHPNDPDAETFGARSSAWYRSYLHWGRDTMGFGLWLFQRSDVSEDGKKSLSPVAS